MKKIFGEWKKTLLFGVAIFAFAILLRLINLTILPIFGDEAIYIRWAQVMRADTTLRFLPLMDGKQPLQMWSIIAFLKIWEDPLLAGRLLSLVTGMGTVIGVFALSFLLFKNKKVSLVASFLYALSPYSVFFDRMALADSMLAFFGVWTLFFGLLTAKSRRLDLAMITGFTLGGALLTKSTALFFVILLPLTWIFSKWSKQKKLIFGNLLRLASLLGVTYLISYCMYNVLRLGPNFHMIAIRNKDYVHPLAHILSQPLDPFLLFIVRALDWIWILGPWVIIPLAALGLVLSMRKYTREILFLGILFGVPILIQAEFAQTFTARYIFFSLPFLYILAASSLLTPVGIFKKLATAGLILFTFLSLRADYYLLSAPERANLPRSERSGYLEDWTSGVGIREVGELIRSEYFSGRDKKIVVGTEGYFGTLPDGLQIYLNDLREIIVIGVGLDIKEIPEPLIESKKAGNTTYLVINSTRFLGDASALGLKLIAVYPKAVRPDGSRESLLFYEVTEDSIPRENL